MSNCLECGGTGWVTLFTSISQCSQCLPGLTFKISDIRRDTQESHWHDLEPMLKAVMNKEAPLLNLYINIDLYKVNIDVDDKPGVLSCVINAYPRANARAWAYNIGAEGISVKSQEAVKLDGDDYLLVQLTREEQLNV